MSKTPKLHNKEKLSVFPNYSPISCNIAILLDLLMIHVREIYSPDAAIPEAVMRKRRRKKRVKMAMGSL